jgi:uncharacterized protein YajQ (UPF0234 family)
MPSFDVVSELNMHEVSNAVDQAKRELQTRFDLRGTKCRFEQDKNLITIFGEGEFHIRQLLDILEQKLIKRGIDILCMDKGKVESNLAESRQVITLRQGLDAKQSKDLVKVIKDSKLKVQASIQGDKVRVTGKKKDDLQEAIAMMRGLEFEMPLQFDNFRE